MDHDQDTGHPPDSAEQLPGDPHDSDSQNGVTDPSPPLVSAPVLSASPTGRRSRGPRAGTGAAPEVRVPGRARGKAGDIPERFDAGAPGAPKWSSHDADILWPEMIEWLQRKGRSPYDVTVNVIRVEPPPRSGVGEGFEANVAVGDGTLTPGDAIKRIVEDYYHLPVSRTPAKYELQFVWRADSRYIAQGYLTCGSPAEIIALRNAQHARRMQQPSQQMPGLGGYSPPHPHSPPPQQMQPMPPPAYPYGYPQYPFPPQQQSQQPQLPMREQLELERLRAENERLRREQHAPPRHPQPGFGAPPVRQLTEEEREERLVTRTIAALRAAGLGAPPAPAPPPNDMISGMRSALAVMKEFRKFSEDASGVFEPDEEPQPRQLGPGPGVGAPPPAEDPYDITELPSHWGDGSQAKLVRDRETGRVDPLGLALMNPYPAQKLMDAAASFMQRFVQRPGLGQPQEEAPQQFDQQQSPQFQPPQQQLPPPQESPQPEESNGGPTDPGYDNL